jgi:glycosyltransferase involved in cell wall biosynthesis
LQQLIEEEGLSECVHIVKNRNDVADLLAAADVFVMPSLWEGLPMALLEAMIAGKAIVASATFGIPEAIAHEQEGLLVPPGDVAALANALGSLLVDDTRRAALGEAARIRAHREFTVRVMADRYENLFAEASLARQRRVRSA